MYRAAETALKISGILLLLTWLIVTVIGLVLIPITACVSVIVSPALLFLIAGYACVGRAALDAMARRAITRGVCPACSAGAFGPAVPDSGFQCATCEATFDERGRRPRRKARTVEAEVGSLSGPRGARHGDGCNPRPRFRNKTPE